MYCIQMYATFLWHMVNKALGCVALHYYLMLTLTWQKQQAVQVYSAVPYLNQGLHDKPIFLEELISGIP